MYQFPQKCRRWLAIGVALFLLPCVLVAAPSSVRYAVQWVHNIPAHVIDIDLSDDSLRVTPALAYGVPGRSESFTQYLLNHQPLAQVTGCYFGFANEQPVGDLVIQSRRYCDGAIGSALVIRPDNTLSIVDASYRASSGWTGCESVAQGGIRLLHRGRVALSPRAQGFHDPNLFRAASRTAIGLIGERELLMVAVTRRIQLSQLAQLMHGLGCQEAMTLDGGGSTGLAFQGKVIVAPSRALPTVLMVVRRAGSTNDDETPSIHSHRMSGLRLLNMSAVRVKISRLR